MLLDTLLQALDKIDSRYYGRLDHKRMLLRACGVTDDDPHQLPVANALFRHNERVFCYELYRHWANLLEKAREATPANSPSILQCELQKEVVGNIAQLFPNVRTLTSRFVPDFLVHEPGSFDHQDLVMEVKADPSVGFSDMLADLKKLNQFMERYLYRRAVFLAINVSQSQLVGLVRGNRHRAPLRLLGRAADITILTRQSAAHPTERMSLPAYIAETRV